MTLNHLVASKYTQLASDMICVGVTVASQQKFIVREFLTGSSKFVMASSKVLSSTVNPYIHEYLVASGYTKAAKNFRLEAKLVRFCFSIYIYANRVLLPHPDNCCL
jgi:hypothetical protein